MISLEKPRKPLKNKGKPTIVCAAFRLDEKALIGFRSEQISNKFRDLNLLDFGPQIFEAAVPVDSVG
ncbi:MAG: hypothetical protein LUE63_05980, partial [Lachnospiraceae bacterium]|nr:hypothetical protein [Lachnospiraceae bacterium]